MTFLTPLGAAHAAPEGPPGKAALAAAADAAKPDTTQTPSDTSPAPRIFYAGVPLQTSSPDLAPYRDPVDGAVCVSPEALAPFGITYIVDPAMGKVSLAGPEGASSTTVSLRRRPGTDAQPDAPAYVPAKAVIEALGGKWQENATTGVCTAFSVLTDVQMIGGQLRVKATFPVLPVVKVDRSRPDLVVIDMPGADIGTLPHALKLDSPNVAQARCGQFSDDTARIVLEMKNAASGPAPGSFALLGGKAATQLVLNPVAATSLPAAPIVVSNNNPSHTVVAKQSGKSASGSTAARPSKPSVAPAVIRSVAFHSVSDQQAQIVVQAGRIPDVRADLSRGRLTVDISNAILASASVADPLGAAKHPFLRAAQLLPRGSAAQLVLDLTRAVNYTVRMVPGGGFILDLMLPKSAGGLLKGKLIAIDPGHGDHDLGAKGTNGTCEKNVNLAIATKLANTLRDMGANVLMTRASDSFIPVDGRPAIANRAGADFFISIHADSGDYNHTVNGSTIYYHMQMPSCKALAQCIAERLSDMGGIRCKGPHSDGRQYGGRFVNGYGVLRNAQMVAVLCECGYMSNSDDVRRLNDPGMQQKIAEAIANGLKDYVEGNPDFDTRNINPQPEGTLAPLGPAPGVDQDGQDAPATSGDGTTAPSTTDGGSSSSSPSGGDTGNSGDTPGAAGN